jgi:RNA polymerase primary sigma factor
MKTPPHRRHDELGPYLDAVRSASRLSGEEEHWLAIAARTGDASARQRLVEHSLGFVVAYARKLHLGTVRLDDVIQEGNLGLVRAMETFDPYAGTRFATYAVWWIRAYVGKYLKEARSIVRPRVGTVAHADLSLDAPFDEEDDSTHLDRVEDDRPGPEEELVTNETAREVREALTHFRGRVGELGWDIIHSRIQHDAPHTLEEVGERWGLSRERVRQVELQTKRLLAVLLEKERQDAA